MAGRSLNKVILIGNLGKDPDVSYLGSGVPVAKFSLATSERWKDQEGNFQEKTEWHNIVAWRRLAEICGQYLKKGSKVYIEGKLTTRSWDDKNTGVKKYMTEVVVDDMIMLDPKTQGMESSQETPSSIPSEPGGAEKEDLPF